MAIATLSVDLVAKLAQFESDLGKAARASQKSADQMASAFGVVKGALGGLAAAFTLDKLVDGTLRIINSIDALNDLKDATGASIENISALEDVAARTGTSFDTVGTSLVKFNAALNKAEPDSAVSRALQAIGLNAKDLKEMDPAEALRLTAVALSGFADDGNKARLTQELFGKSLREVAPFLKDLSEQAQLNATVTTEQAQAAEDFNKKLFAMQKNLADAGRSIVNNMLPALSAMAAEMLAAQKASVGFWDSLRIQGLQNPFKSLGENMASVRETIAGLEADRARFLKGGNDTRSIDTALAAKKRELEYFKDLQRQSAQSSPTDQSSAEAARLGLTGPKDRPSVGDIGGNPPKAKAVRIDDDARALASYVEGLQKELTTTEKLTEQEKALNFLKSIGRMGEISQVRELVLGQAQLIDQAHAQAEARKLFDEAGASNSKYLQDMAKEQQAMDATTAGMRAQLEEIGLTTEQLDKLKLSRLENNLAMEQQKLAQMNLQNSSQEEIDSMQARIDKLREQLGLTQQMQEAQARLAAPDGYQSYIKGIGTEMERAAAVTKNAFSMMEDALVQWAMTGQLNSKRLADQIISDLIRIQIQDNITKPLAQGMKNAGGVSGIFSMVKGIFGFADGGNPPVGQVSLVGERGPELFVPKTAGTIIPNGALGGSITVNQPLTINAPGAGADTVAQIQQMMPGLIAANAKVVEGVVRQAMARKGRSF